MVGESFSGVVTTVRSGVIDAEFAKPLLPDINGALTVEWDRPEPLMAEVHAISMNTVFVDSRCAPVQDFLKERQFAHWVDP